MSFDESFEVIGRKKVQETIEFYMNIIPKPKNSKSKLVEFAYMSNDKVKKFIHTPKNSVSGKSLSKKLAKIGSISCTTKTLNQDCLKIGKKLLEAKMSKVKSSSNIDVCLTPKNFEISEKKTGKVSGYGTPMLGYHKQTGRHVTKFRNNVYKQPEALSHRENKVKSFGIIRKKMSLPQNSPKNIHFGTNDLRLNPRQGQERLFVSSPTADVSSLTIKGWESVFPE